MADRRHVRPPLPPGAPSSPGSSAPASCPPASSSQASLDAHRRAQPRAQRVRRRLRRRGARGRGRRVGPGDERPFAGVPIAIKNNRAIAGRRLTYGAEFIGDWIAPYDHNVVRAPQGGGLRRRRHARRCPSGASCRGRTRSASGRRATRGTRRGRSGGSSGGSATAVAAGMVPDRARQRRRRVDAHPGRVLRPRRPQAPARPHLAGARDRARASSPSTACSRAPSATPRCCSTCSPGPRSATRRGRRRRPSRSRPPRRASRRPCASPWSTNPPIDVPLDPARVQAARDAAAPARVARPRGRGGAGRRGARTPLLQALHGALRPARHAADRLRPRCSPAASPPRTTWSR